MPTNVSLSYSLITESPDQLATSEQLSMLRTRYQFAGDFSDGKDVLEVACGTGIGLGYLAARARSVLAGDIDNPNLSIARKTYEGDANVIIREMLAEQLPVPDESCDVVILFEAIYYLNSVISFLKEAHRVLRPGGVLVISSVNNEWDGFNPSPFSIRYLSHDELRAVLEAVFRKVSSWYAFQDRPVGVRARITARIRQYAVTAKLIPKKVSNKKFLKRVFYGRLSPLPRRLELDDVDVEQLREVRPDDIEHQKMLYFAATK